MNYLILLDHVVVSGSRFLLSILIARALGLEDFGVYALLWTIVTFASAMQTPVAITPMMQLGPRVLEHRQEEFFATAMFAQLAYSVGVVPFITVSAAVITWGRPDAIAIILALNIYVLVFNQYEYIRRYFFTNGFNFAAFCFDAVLYTLLIAIILWFSRLSGMSISSFLALSSVSASLFCLLTFRLYQFRQTRLVIHLAQGRRILRIVSPLVVSALAGFISGHAFVYATAYLLGTAEVGGIAAVRNIVGPLMILLMALENSLIRELALLSNEPKKMHAHVRSVTIVWFSLFVLAAGTLSAFAEPLLRITYGLDFTQFSALVYWFGAASVAQVVSRIQTVKLRTENKYEAIKLANIGTMLLTVALSPAFIWAFGLTGAGMSVLLIAGSILVLQDFLDPDGISRKIMRRI